MIFADLQIRRGGQLRLPKQAGSNSHCASGLNVEIAVAEEQGFGRVLCFSSAGVADLKTENELTLDELLSFADQALYQSKECGRDQVSVWQEG